MKIVVDQGHGGSDPGASGCGLVEADLTGRLGLVVKEKLGGYEVEVLLAPRGALHERAAFANRAGAAFFVSLHINAGGGTGFESYIHPAASPKTLALAQSVHKTVADFYAAKGFPDRGLKLANFAVLRETAMPAVLLENLFIDNAGDASFVGGNLTAIGNEIAWAVAQALQLQPKGESSRDAGPDNPVTESGGGAGLDEILRDLQKIEAEVYRLRSIIDQLAPA